MRLTFFFNTFFVNTNTEPDKINYLEHQEAFSSESQCVTFLFHILIINTRGKILKHCFKYTYAVLF